MLPSFTPPGIRDRRRTADDVIFGIGTGSPAAFLWETADANANAFLLRLPTGGATDVPVFIIGDASAENVDLGMFNGFTQPLVATLDSDQDSYVGFHYSGDDVGIITMRLGSGGTIRNHVIPDVASSTIAVLGAAQTWSGAQTFSADPQVNADLDFVGPQAITTTSGALTITPATDTLFSNGTGVVLGHTGQLTVAGYTGEFQMLGTTDDSDTVAVIAGFSNDGGGPKLVFGKGRGGSIANDATSVADGDDVGAIMFNAADGTDMASAVATIIVEIDGDPGSNDTPGRMSFRTTADGAASVTENMRIASDGGIFAYNLLAASASTDVNLNGSNELHTVTSSRAFKENERTLEVDSSKLYDLSLKTFEWTAASGSPGETDFGVIAEDVQAIIPELVSMRKDRVSSEVVDDSGQPLMVQTETGAFKPYAIRMPNLSLLMLDALQKLAARVTVLES